MLRIISGWKWSFLIFQTIIYCRHNWRCFPPIQVYWFFPTLAFSKSAWTLIFHFNQVGSYKRHDNLLFGCMLSYCWAKAYSHIFSTNFICCLFQPIRQEWVNSRLHINVFTLSALPTRRLTRCFIHRRTRKSGLVAVRSQLLGSSLQSNYLKPSPQTEWRPCWISRGGACDQSPSLAKALMAM